MPVRVADVDAHEGPVYVPGENALYFTTLPQRDGLGVPRVQIKRLPLDGEPTVVRAYANAANGMALGRDGRLLICEQGTPSTSARITAFDPSSGEVEILVDNWNDLRLNSPNDVVQASDGAIWFTDPTYGFLQGFRPRAVVGDRVYRFEAATGSLQVVADSLDKPNGLALAPDERTLYVTDSGANQEPGSFYSDRPHHVVAFDVAPFSAELTNERVFAEISPGFPDGIKCDADGRVYVSSLTGVQVFSPEGERLGEIELPGAVNFTFGGLGRDVLFITADTAIWAATLDAKGREMPAIRTRRIIDETGAQAVLDAAESKALEQGSRVVIAVVDPWGELVAFRRTNGAQIASSRVALDKARTAAIFVRPSREMEEQVTNGRIGALALHGASALVGGIPLKVDGETIGAIGTSGETPDEDEQISSAGARADLSYDEVPALTQEGAKLAAEAIGAEAAKRGVAPVVSAVDAGGALIYLHRPDDAQVASVEVTTDKARTAAIYRRPSKDFEDQASGGRPSALHLARAVPLQGGEPIVCEGKVIGAVGVSGATSADEDRELALIGAEAAARSASASGNGSPNGAAFFAASTVEERFREGGLLLDTPAYKIDAGRRVEPGEVEYHERVTDVMHVVRGTATVVTGGEMHGAREVAPGELRAAEVDGGTRHQLHAGDVLAIPNGVPHQFVDVSDPFLYFVVKVEA